MFRLLFFLFCGYFLLSCSAVETVKSLTEASAPPVAPPPAAPPPVAAPPATPPPANSLVVPSVAPAYSIEERTIANNRNPISLTGRAVYEAININSFIGSGFNKIVKPIRYAQISVFEKVGNQVNVVQNSKTDQDGSFTLRVPGNTNLLLVIYARTQGIHGNFSVEDPCQLTSPFRHRCQGSAAPQPYLAYPSNVYALQKLITVTEFNKVGLTLTASFPFNTIRTAISTTGRYSGELLGGAFHILDKMIQAVDFLTEKVQNCSAAITGCVNFSTSLNKLPLLKAYWRQGFNALGFPSSFYRSPNVMGILGGDNHDPLFADNDHFDASIIIHEFGHYLEDHWAISDSLGGIHSGGIIDPRLAWSEGFANFFQGAVLNRPEYKDFYFESNSNILKGFSIPLENQSPGVGQYSLDILAPHAEEEGNFREFSIARLLWDSIDNKSGLEDEGKDNITGKFSFIWASLTHAEGFKSSNYFLRSMGLFNQIIHTTLNQSWPDLLSLHKNVPASNFRRQFAAKLITCPIAEELNFSTKIYTNQNSISKLHFYSDYLHNYDIFTYTHLGGVFNLNINYSVSDPSAPDVVILIVAKHDSYLPEWVSSPEGGVLLTRASVGVSASVTVGQVQQTVSTTENTTLVAGTYMIILAGDSNKTTSSTVNYNMSINSDNLCLEE